MTTILNALWKKMNGWLNQSHPANYKCFKMARISDTVLVACLLTPFSNDYILLI